jgi:hypothetical protein
MSMIDNRKVKDSHKEGIGRVTQRKGENKRTAQSGKMGEAKEKAHWDRPKHGSLTPRKA